MTARQPFTFGIPLLPRACAGNWALVEALLELTLATVLAQTDPDFAVLVAGHDRPQVLPDDPRVRFVEATWPVEAVRADNQDRGRKTHLINERVRSERGGLLMFLDADDWVDARLVEAARALLAPQQVAGVIETGFAVDFQTLRAAPVPHPQVFPQAFHRICGSSAVLQLDPRSMDPLRRDPYAVLHEHHRLADTAAALGAAAQTLPLTGGYLINTSENHSEVHGPFSDWRSDFTRAVNRHGTVVDVSLARRFGLDPKRLGAASQRFFG